MKAGDYVYELDQDDLMRGALVEFLCDAIEAVLDLEPEPALSWDRLSNGQAADTLYRCLDVIVTTPEQWDALKKFCEEDREDHDEEDEEDDDDTI